MQLKPNAHFYDVRFSRPVTRTYKVGTEERSQTCNENVHVMVVAESVAAAVTLTERAFPACTIHQVNHRGGNCSILIQDNMFEI